MLLYWPPTWPPCQVVANQEMVSFWGIFALILKKESILLWIVCKLFVRDTHDCCIFPSLLFHLWASVSNCLLKMVNLTVLLHKEFEIPTLRSKFFEILNFVFLSEVAHKSFCVKFSGLISKLKILDKSY